MKFVLAFLVVVALAVDVQGFPGGSRCRDDDDCCCCCCNSFGPFGPFGPYGFGGYGGWGLGAGGGLDLGLRLGVLGGAGGDGGEGGAGGRGLLGLDFGGGLGGGIGGGYGGIPWFGRYPYFGNCCGCGCC